MQKLKQKNLSNDIYVDSCGTHDYHQGQAPDNRSQTAILKRGIDISSQKSRIIQKSDFSTFDYILVMDKINLEHIDSMMKDEFREKLFLFLEFAKNTETDEVPDPYYGGINGFELVLDLLDYASEGFISYLEEKL